jgi:broad specificity phosphatase PhoE
MTTDGLLLARHGETDDNAAGRFQGRRDPPLNERGREQALALADLVAGEGIRALWTSPLRRAHETAAIVGRALGLPPEVDERLVEIDVGDWAGRTNEELAHAEPTAYGAWRAGDASFRFPGGESIAEQRERVAAALRDIAASSPRPALVVCHGGVIRAARRVLGLANALEVVENGSVHRL